MLMQDIKNEKNKRMKIKIKHIVISLFIGLGAFSCSGVANQEFGESVVYMPQSTKQSGGVNNNYNVQLSSVLIDTVITVGAYRSGLESLSAFSVELTIDDDTLAKAITLSQSDENHELYQNAVILPVDCYSLPEKISFTSGQRESSVNLIIHKEKLFRQWIDGSQYVLPVRIEKPTKYVLNEKLSLTMFFFTKK